MHATDGTTDCLFVYGTLMPQSRHPMALRLAAESTDLGQATIYGQLYDLGAYPGARPPAAPHDERVQYERVHGAIVKLHRPPHSLRWLDSYEGCGEHDAEPYGFERVTVQAFQMTGQPLAVWVYFYRGPMDHARHLPNGRYALAESPLSLRS